MPENHAGKSLTGSQNGSISDTTFPGFHVDKLNLKFTDRSKPMKALTTLTMFAVLAMSGVAQSNSQTEADLQVMTFGWTQHTTSATTSVKIVDDNANAPVARRDPRTSNLRTTVDERFERQRDTQLRMADLRSLDVVAQASHAESVYGRTPRQYYEYYVRVKNAGAKVVQNVYWQYDFNYSDEQSSYSRQFFCRAKVKPEENKILRLYSFSAPSRVIKVSKDGAAEVQSKDNVIINQIQFSDGSSWERPGWKAEVISEKILKALDNGQCTSL